MKTIISACGKAILFGEHSVVYGHPAIAVPISSARTCAYVQEAGTLTISSVNIGGKYEVLKEPLKKGNPAYALQETVFNTLEYFGLPKEQNLEISVNSALPFAGGLGSSASMAIAVIRALAAHFNRKISDLELYNLAYKSEIINHSMPSGIDIATIIYEKPIYFKTNEPNIIKPLTCNKKIPLIVADTGMRSITADVVKSVKKEREKDPAKYDNIFSKITEIVEHAQQMIEKDRIHELGPLMNQNHELLQQADISSPELDKLVAVAKGAGALGAKLVGGGRGGCMIALAESNPLEIKKALINAGAINAFFTEIF